MRFERPQKLVHRSDCYSLRTTERLGNGKRRRRHVHRRCHGQMFHFVAAGHAARGESAYVVRAWRSMPGIRRRLPVMMLGNRTTIAMATRSASGPCRQSHWRIHT
jgi:hypothetical protein